MKSLHGPNYEIAQRTYDQKWMVWRKQWVSPYQFIWLLVAIADSKQTAERTIR